jgi:galactose mutarotase-like enzyme
MNQNDLKKYVGTMDQLARIRMSVLDEGRGRGMRIADVDNGSGLRFTVLLDRGMDIGDALFNGMPVAYQTPVGLVHPAHFESDGFRWLRSFGGGLLAGCGLRTAGNPAPEEGMEVAGPLGLHGRLSNIPAEDVHFSKVWKNGRYELSVSGTIREVSFFAENLELRRTISTAMGDHSISIKDEVRNIGIRPSPLMMIYHINLGYPLLNEDSVVEGQVLSTKPRTDAAAACMDSWNLCQPPTAGCAETCFYHDVEAGQDGMARMTLRNQTSGRAVEVAYRKAELPFFTQWKMMGEQEYVMGLEPANCHPDGQAAEEKNGTLKILEPGESVEHYVVISFS